MEKENLKNLYKEIYSVTSELSKLIELDDYDGIGVFLDKKDELIVKINSVKSKMTFSEEEKKEFNIIIDKIKNVEEKNLQVMQEKQEVLKKQISKTNKEHKTISSYKTKKENVPRIFDERE